MVCCFLFFSFRGPVPFSLLLECVPYFSCSCFILFCSSIAVAFLLSCFLLAVVFQIIHLAFLATPTFISVLSLIWSASSLLWISVAKLLLLVFPAETPSPGTYPPNLYHGPPSAPSSVSEPGRLAAPEFRP